MLPDEDGTRVLPIVQRQSNSIADLPACAVDPLVTYYSTTGCGIDLVCVCKSILSSAAFTSSLQAACSTTDSTTAVNLIGEVCVQADSSTAAPSTSNLSSPSTPETTSYLSPNIQTPTSSPSNSDIVSSPTSTISLAATTLTLTASAPPPAETNASPPSTSLTGPSIIGATNPTPSSAALLSTGAIVGITVGAVITLLLISCFLGCFVLPRRGKGTVAEAPYPARSRQTSLPPTPLPPTKELNGGLVEIDGREVQELDGSEMRGFEGTGGEVAFGRANRVGRVDDGIEDKSLGSWDQINGGDNLVSPVSPQTLASGTAQVLHRKEAADWNDGDGNEGASTGSSAVMGFGEKHAYKPWRPHNQH